MLVKKQQVCYNTFFNQNALRKLLLLLGSRTSVPSVRKKRDKLEKYRFLLIQNCMFLILLLAKLRDNMTLVYPIKCSLSNQEMDFTWLWKRDQESESSSSLEEKCQGEL